ncbi:NADH-quinone oxidoreductase subunit [Trichinella pseudospiralis]
MATTELANTPVVAKNTARSADSTFTQTMEWYCSHRHLVPRLRCACSPVDVGWISVQHAVVNSSLIGQTDNSPLIPTRLFASRSKRSWLCAQPLTSLLD